jgi:hypothetical protein
MAGSAMGRPQTVQPTIQTSAPSNVFGAAAQNLQQASTGAQAEMQYMPQQFTAGQLSQTNLAPYQNPFTSQVINQTAADLERQRQIQQAQIGAKATAAGAFGGSRQGVTEALTNEAFARQLAQTSAGLRQAGFQQAQEAAQKDIASQMVADQFNINSGLSGSEQRLRAGLQLANLGNIGFGMGQTVTQNLAQQGAQQQLLQQALMDAARDRFAGYANAPAQSIGYLSSALSSSQIPTSVTSSRDLGLYDHLTMAAQVAPMIAKFSDSRLKTNVKLITEAEGINFYTWDWNEEGKRVADPKQVKFGVMADELQEIHPHLVHRGSDGYLRVDYAGLNRELGQ